MKSRSEPSHGSSIRQFFIHGLEQHSFSPSHSELWHKFHWTVPMFTRLDFPRRLQLYVFFLGWKNFNAIVRDEDQFIFYQSFDRRTERERILRRVWKWVDLQRKYSIWCRKIARWSNPFNAKTTTMLGFCRFDPVCIILNCTLFLQSSRNATGRFSRQSSGIKVHCWSICCDLTRKSLTNHWIFYDTLNINSAKKFD